MNRLSKNESYQLAILLCAKLALDLDADDHSSIASVFQMLSDLSVEDVLWAMRTQVGIERCVKHELDCNEHAIPVLRWINGPDFIEDETNVQAKDKDKS